MLGNPRNYYFFLAGGRGEESRNPGIWNPKSHGRLKSGIQVPVTKIWNQVQTTKNSESAEWNPEYKTALDPLPNGINRRSYQPQKKEQNSSHYLSVEKKNHQVGIKPSRRVIACAIIVDEQNQEHGCVQEVNQWFLS